MGFLAAAVPAEAGNILRVGGSSSAAVPGAASGGAGTLIPASSPGTIAAQNLLSRTTQALAAVQNMQAAARMTAQNLTTSYLVTHAGLILAPVPDGLVDNRPAGGAGGLIPDNGIVPDPNNPGSYILSGTWTGVASLQQQPSTDANGQPGATVTVTQSAQQALLNWQTFNVGGHTTLNFDQSLGGADVATWIAFNKINSSGVPSQILGSIQAQGQVYVINPNGIIFGGSSQVNAHALVASSLPINTNLLNNGLLNNPDGQFLFSALPIPVLPNGNGTPAFTPPTITGTYGDVEIQPGAQLSAPTTPEHVGGLVALIGPNVYNGGTINTPDGQTILAAGLQVGLAAHNTNDPTLRGLDVYVGAVADPAQIVQTASGTAGTAENADIDQTGAITASGDIEAPRADVTIAGQNVNQPGIIDNSTSVSLNGRIDLLADYGATSNSLVYNNPSSPPGTPLFLFQSTGTVALGPGSVTQILPELANADLIVGTTLSLPSLVNIQGQAIHLESNAAGDPGMGAIILAPGATVPASNPALAAGTALPLKAGVTLNAGSWTTLQLGTTGAQSLFYNTAPPNGAGQFQIYFDPGATIDVSGSQNVSASVDENIVPVQLLGAQLADSPLQRNGPLRGQTVDVDILQTGNYKGQEWAGTPLADTTGYINLIEHSVGELTTDGGTVALNAGGAVVMQPYSTINVSGGWINYTGGVVSTTKVVTDGHILDISDATPDLVYSGIYTGTSTTTDAKWGVTQTYTSPELGSSSGGQYEPGYVQGGNAGTISITAPSMALDGSLLGTTVAGPHQRTPLSQIDSNTEFGATTILPTMEPILSVPTGGTLSLTFQGANTAGALISPTPPYITFQSGVIQTPAGPFTLDSSANPQSLPEDRQTSVFLSPDLVSVDGFSNLTITNADGDIEVQAGLIVPDLAGGGTNGNGGNINFTGQNITIDSQVLVSAPSGSLIFTVDDISPYTSYTAPNIPDVDPNRGKFTLGAGASLSTAGLIVDDRATAAASGTLPLFTDGGTITINAYQVDLPAGSTIDVSGGVQMTAASKLTYGKGGNLSINAVDPAYSQLGLVPGTDNNDPGQLILDAALTGYSGKSGSGGTLNITAPLIQIGGSQLLNGDTSGGTLWLNETDASGNLLQPDFFNQGGFSNFTLTGLGGFATDASGNLIPYQFLPAVDIAPDTVIAPQVWSWMATAPTGGGLVRTLTLLPAGQRTPASLTFNAKGVNNIFLTATDSVTGKMRGDLVVNSGVLIETDPQAGGVGNVTLKGDTVAVLGSIIVPGGTISVTGGNSSGTLFLAPADASLTLPTVDLGPGSVLSAAGEAMSAPNTTGRPGLSLGTVVPGGNITVDGNIVAEAGATLDVSGASGQFNVLSSQIGSGVAMSESMIGANYTPYPVPEDSNGGTITLTGEEELFTDARLLAKAGAPSATGGSLSVSSGVLAEAGATTASKNAPQEPNLILTQSGPTIPGPFYSSEETAIGNPVLAADGKTPILGMGYFAADSFNDGGFVSLTLGGTVQFSGKVSLEAGNSLTIGNSGVLLADPNPTFISSLTLNAPYVALGQPLLAPAQPGDPAVTIPFGVVGNTNVYVKPVYGTGVLTVTASELIDVGNLSLQGIGVADFDATNGGNTSGAIRGDGTLDVAGAINLTAGQIYPPTATTFNIAAYDYTVAGQLTSGSVTILPGQGLPALPLSAGGMLNIYASNITQGGVLRAPIGSINLGANSNSNSSPDPISGQSFPLTQTLTLAPGSVTSVSAVDPATGQALTIPYGINLNGTAWIDPTGMDITIKGNGQAGAGLPAKTINLTAATVNDATGSTIDLTGGGDLYAYRWVTGLGGTNDILNTSSSFAVIPLYSANYAPFAPYNASQYNGTNQLLNANGALTDPGYYVPPKPNGQPVLSVGDRVYLGASNGLPAGFYTLLPARYALLPGAFLVTPQSGIPTSTVLRADGSSLVSGYQFNGFSPSQPLLSSFEVDPQSVVLSRAEYDPASANSFLSQSAQAQNLAIPRLPIDSGQLVFSATQQMSIAGKLDGDPAAGGRGSQVDINSPVDILIADQATATANYPNFGGLVLDPTDLSNFGADSLLIGGVRQATTSGTTVTVSTNNLTVDNAGNALSGPDVILVANQNLTLAAGADVEQGPRMLPSPADALQVGQTVSLTEIGGGASTDTLNIASGGAAVGFPQGVPSGELLVASAAGTVTPPNGGTPAAFGAGSSIIPAPGSTVAFNEGGGNLTSSGTVLQPDGTSVYVPIQITVGDGTLLRVSSDPSASIARAGATTAVSSLPSVNPVAMSIGAGARIAGGSVTLDSTNATTLASDVTVSGEAINLDSGQISLQLGTSGSPQGLVLPSETLDKLQSSANSLSLLSYSSIDIYGSGAVGKLDANGQPTFASLALHAGEIDDATDVSGDMVTFNAQKILLDNSANGTVSGISPGPSGGALTFNAGTGTIELGANQLNINQYNTVNLNAGGGILVQGTGGFTTQGALTMETPILTAATAASQTIAAGGTLTVQPSTGASTVTVAGGLGAGLTLIGTGASGSSGIAVNSDIAVSSGALALHATGGDVSVGSTGILDVSGTPQTFFDAPEYTSGGQVTLTVDAGDVSLATGSKVDVSAPLSLANDGTRVGNAGSLTINVPTGSFNAAANTMFGQGGVGGQGGTFYLDTRGIQLNGDISVLGSALASGGFTQSVSIRDRTDPVVTLDQGVSLKAHAVNISADQGEIDVFGIIDASGFLNSSPSAPLAGSPDPAYPAGGTINLAAGNNIVLEPTAWLTAAGYCYSDAGKGGSISLSAGSYTSSQFNQNAVVNIQPGAQIELGVANNFTPEDLALNAGVAVPADNRTDFFTGTLQISEPQTAFYVDNGNALINSLGGSVNNASSIVLAGLQVFDLSGTGTPETVNPTGSITSINSSGIIDSIVEQAVKGNGTTFVSNIYGNNPSLLANSLINIEPGAEIVNNGTATNTIVTLELGGRTGSFISIANVSKASPITLPIPGGIFAGDTITLSGTSLSFTVNFADGTSATVVGGTFTADTRPIQSITFSNSSATPRTAKLLFSSGTVPIAVLVSALPAGITYTLSSSANNTPTTIITSAGDLTLANTWDLSTYRFGPNNTPGILTLRAAGDLVFNFDASLSDGFNPSPASSAAGLWQAPLLPTGSQSWSYNLIAGADLSAADFQQVQPGAGSLLLGEGSPALPATATTNDTTIIPEYYQTIRTGTGNINIFSGQDVQLLNSLATIYTAGSQAPALAPGEFDVPNLQYTSVSGVITAPNNFATTASYYPAQYSQNGGDVTISAQGDIIHELAIVNPSTNQIQMTPDSSPELPTNWLYRRGYVNSDQFAVTHTSKGNTSTGSNEVASTSWWVDFSNFFEGVGALGGGNVTLLAGHDVSNVDAVVPTNARVTKILPNGDQIAADQTLTELGGGDLMVQAGNDINGGVYYVERGSGMLSAGNEILTNSTRAALPVNAGSYNSNQPNYITDLPTTLFLGKGSFDVTAGGSVLLGPVANPFLLPQGIDNDYFDKTYFSTYATTDAVDVSSLRGNVTLEDNVDSESGQVGLNGSSLIDWYNNVLNQFNPNSLAGEQPWLDLVETNVVSQTNPTSGYFVVAAALMPGTLRATAFSGDLNLIGGLTLSPSQVGTVDLAAAGSINGVQPNELTNTSLAPSASNTFLWDSSTINLSDASPNSLPGIFTPSSLTATGFPAQAPQQRTAWDSTPVNLLQSFASFFTESGSTDGTIDTLQAQQALHGTIDVGGNLVPLQTDDPNPVNIYAETGDISGVTLFTGETAKVVAGSDITDIALYLQNDNASDVSVVSAGRDIVAYDPDSPLRRLAAHTTGNQLDGLFDSTQSSPLAGDIQISGPGTLEVLAGRNLNLGVGPDNADGTAVGITSIGNARNPALPFAGADVVAGAGIGGPANGLNNSQLDFTAFIDQFLTPTSIYWAGLLPELQTLLPLENFSAGLPAVWPDLTDDQKELLAPQILDTFYLVLRDAGRDRPSVGNYNTGFSAIADLFPGNAWQGDISLTSREIKTESGGDIDILAPGGQLTVGLPVNSGSAADQGILTDDGGNISIFTNGNVNVGVSRIFTLYGGNVIIWSSTGNIAAGSASKTVSAAPPTRVLVDPQSGSVETDLAGLATGGGIGVLATVVGVAPGDVDLIAPAGFIDAGDAGIRASGTVNVSAVQVLNASNIQAGGTITGTPAPPAAPNVASIASASNTSVASSNAAAEVAKQEHAPVQQEEFPSIITVLVVGYGGSDMNNGDDNSNDNGSGNDKDKDKERNT